MRISLLLLLGAFLTFCSSSNSSRVREIRIQYGEITGVSRVTMPSAAPAGAIVGGFTGLILSSGSSPGRRAAAGVGGAAIGGLAVSALERDRRSYRYQIRFNSGSETSYITENGFLQVGDCVAVERGEYANMRRVSDALCESPPVLRQVVNKRATEASQCHDAKDEVLRATTDQEIDQATRKVRILCQF